MPILVTRLVTSPRLPAGLLTAQAWDVLRAAPLVTAAEPTDLTDALALADVDVEIVTSTEAADRLTRVGGVWLVPVEGDDAFTIELGQRLAIDPDAFTVVHLDGSWDPPGGKLLDLVAVIDRLRSPGGCPWDGKQTHESLAPYLLEETYEALDAIAAGDHMALREELGDLLMQPLLHARIASEHVGFDVDAVAGDIAAKLIFRHPHVFANESIPDGDIHRLWDERKRAEKSERRYATDGVPSALPALALASKYLSRVGRADVPVERPSLPTDTIDVSTATTSSEAFGEVLLALVAAASGAGIDAEIALRTAAESFASRARAAQDAERAEG